MITVLVEKMTGIIRNRSKMSVDTGILIAQLIALAKIVGEEKYTGISSLGELGTTPDCKEKIKYCFDDIFNNKVLGLNSPAFQLNYPVLETFDNTQLEELCSLVDSAVNSKILDYSDCVNAIEQRFERRDGILAIPNEVKDLMISLANINKTDSVYCPFISSYTLASGAGQFSREVFAEAFQKNSFPYLINILCDIELNIEFGDPVIQPKWIENGKLRLFDISLAVEPSRVRYNPRELNDWFERFPENVRTGEVLQTRHILSQTNKRGVIAIPNGFLSRTSSGETEFKKSIIDSNIVEAVIGLPSNLFYTTGHPFSLVVFNKEKQTDKVFFINAASDNFYELNKRRGKTLKNIDGIIEIFKKGEKSEYSYPASKNECAENNYNLVADRYVLSPEKQVLKNLIKNSHVAELKDIAELIRPQSIRRSENVAKGNVLFEVSINDIPESGYISQPMRTFEIDDNDVRRMQRQRLEPLDILVVVKGTVGLVGIVPEEFEGDWVASQAFQIIRLPKNSSIKTESIVLHMYLRSEVGQALLKSRVSGSSQVSIISNQDMMTLPVITVSEENKQGILDTFEKEKTLHEKVELLKDEMKKLHGAHWFI